MIDGFYGLVSSCIGMFFYKTKIEYTHGMECNKKIARKFITFATPITHTYTTHFELNLPIVFSNKKYAYNVEWTFCVMNLRHYM